jgi:hypothetical protein
MVMEPLGPPAQRRGFDESTTSKWRAALLMFVLRPLLKGLGRINILKQLLIYFC